MMCWVRRWTMEEEEGGRVRRVWGGRVSYETVGVKVGLEMVGGGEVEEVEEEEGDSAVLV